MTKLKNLLGTMILVAVLASVAASQSSYNFNTATIQNLNGGGNQTQGRSNTAGATNSNWTQSSDAIHGYAVGIKATGAAPADITPSQISPMVPFN